MATLTASRLNTVLGYQEAPVFSLYMPTHRTHPDNATDPGLFRELVQRLSAMAEGYPNSEESRPILSKFEALANDYQFWQHTRDGLAIFATKNAFDIYRLRKPVRPLAVVADSAHVKPLLKYLQANDRYHLLVLTTNTAQLFEGDRYQLDEIDISGDDVPDAMIDALDHELRDLHATLAAYRTATGEKWDTGQNHGLRKTAIENDIEQFFRAVDRAIMAKYSIPTRLPLILAALPEHHHIFRQVSRNGRLMEAGIKVDATALNTAELQRRAWQVMEPNYTQRLDRIISTYRQATADGMGADQLEQIVKDAFDGKVATLLLEEDRIIPGRIMGRADVVYHTSGETPGTIDDVLDDLAEVVMRFGGDVWIIPNDRMPSETGAAAINRF